MQTWIYEINLFRLEKLKEPLTGRKRKSDRTRAEAGEEMYGANADRKGELIRRIGPSSIEDEPLEPIPVRGRENDQQGGEGDVDGEGVGQGDSVRNQMLGLRRD